MGSAFSTPLEPHQLQAHDNPMFEHTSFDPTEGGRLFQGTNKQ